MAAILAPAKPRSLLITPITPRATGNGLAMRAHALLQALAECSEAHTLIVPVADSAGDGCDEARCQRMALPSPATAAASWLASAAARGLLASAPVLPRRARLAAPICSRALAAGQRFDLVYVLRLYLAGTGLPFLAPQSAARVVLDIDEDDAALTRQLADLCERQGKQPEAAELRAEAVALERFSAAALPLFHQIACASQVEAQALRARGVSALTLPNVVAVRALERTAAATAAPQLLFIGNLDYPPNRDAALRLARDILPAVRRHLPRARLALAGSGGRSLREACGDDRDGVDWLGYVQDIDRLYERSSVMVAPLRAGGGTRLKVLEAFERGTPVVATHKAVEGLAVTAGRHALLADSDAELAMAVVRLVGDTALAGRLASAARQLVSEHYSTNSLSRRIASVVASLPAGTAAPDPTHRSQDRREL